MPKVYGNSIWNRSPYTEVYQIYEVDEINENDLYVDMVFRLAVSPALANFSNNATVDFRPWSNRLHSEPKIYNISVCELGGGYGSNYLFGSVSVDCTRYAQNISIQSMENKYYYPEYLLTIPIENSSEWKTYTVHIQYAIPNFVITQGSNYILSFESGCYGENCNVDSWDKTVLLPSATSVLEDFSGDDVRIIGLEKNRWLLGMRGGKSSFIRYYDSTERNYITPLGWTIIGFVLSTFGTVFWKKKRKIYNFLIKLRQSYSVR